MPKKRKNTSRRWLRRSSLASHYETADRWPVNSHPSLAPIYFHRYRLVRPEWRPIGFIHHTTGTRLYAFVDEASGGDVVIMHAEIPSPKYGRARGLKFGDPLYSERLRLYTDHAQIWTTAFAELCRHIGSGNIGEPRNNEHRVLFEHWLCRKYSGTRVAAISSGMLALQGYWMPFLGMTYANGVRKTLMCALNRWPTMALLIERCLNEITNVVQKTEEREYSYSNIARITAYRSKRSGV